MSLNRIIPHASAGYIEVVFDGHEDWMSAVQTIEQIVAAIDELSIYRILLDFGRVNMHVAVAEAPHVAKLFDAFANHRLSFGIIRAGDARGAETIAAFADGMRSMGHSLEYLESAPAIEHWIRQRTKLARRAG
ncbi:hypothetical protein [uncultured Maricaulis sp.]|uniref:hypothetical protein n=1 Tax=uncultured Maricaulis sp. TaxID=174710 RepID=UPI0030DD6CA2|tara:strand:+ start:58646 stop:59044 length:399 start_codon:yes stop_codon:yes gene_type:complete